MSTRKLSNISVADYRKFLTRIGCKCIRAKGGHEHWSRTDLLRPITFQSHIEPVPEFIIKNGLRILGKEKKYFFQILDIE